MPRAVPFEVGITAGRREKHSLVERRVLNTSYDDKKVGRSETFVKKLVWNKNDKIEKVARSPSDA